jgi:hypothetical protein
MKKEHLRDLSSLRALRRFVVSYSGIQSLTLYQKGRQENSHLLIWQSESFLTASPAGLKFTVAV